MKGAASRRRIGNESSIRFLPPRSRAPASDWLSRTRSSAPIAAPPKLLQRSDRAPRWRFICLPPRRFSNMQKRIVVADDDPTMRAALQEALCGLGHGVDIFPDGEEAERQLKQFGADVVVSDLRMPGMT